MVGAIACVVGALALTTGTGVAAPGAVQSTPFEASFEGTFTLTFFTGPELTHELHFHGTGQATRLGSATVDGYSTLRPVLANPSCNRIVDDTVALTAADGATLTLTNDAVDCVEVTPDGRVLIHGNGTYTILGGSARLAGAGGTGSVSTEARVTGTVPGGVTGTFDPLVFEGTISR